MPTAYDTWLDRSAADEAGDAYEEYRDEWIADRAEELMAVRLRDAGQVKAALGDFFTVDAEDQLETALARFYLAYEEADIDAQMAEAAKVLADTLRPTVEGRIRDESRSDASTEFHRRERNAPTAAVARMELSL